MRIGMGGLLATMILPGTALGQADHAEFDAVLQAQFQAETCVERSISLHFVLPDDSVQRVRWRLELLPRHGSRLLASLSGERYRSGTLELRWRLPARPGLYRLRLRATSGDGAGVEQAWPVAIGTMPATTPAPAELAASAAAMAAGQTVYLGNLHSQTNHSDGGGTLDTCHGAQAPQSGAAGPTAAYAYANAHGLAFLMTSEHNHLYDGSDSTNLGADATAARALFHDGLRQAASWNAAHAGLLAIYGQEWGVISHGGHLNILNGDQLLGWERNAQGALLADIETPKSDYATLYAMLRQHGWYGQFNHPQRDQFRIGDRAPGWTADGDATMLLCEVMNSNAFSNRTDEDEPRHSIFEAGCNALLEAGYHVAFSSNQDNHCANWGTAYTNRTAIVLPRGIPLSSGSLLAALRARRVYATMDQHAQVLLTANRHLMGERFANRGPLTLEAHYTSSSGRLAAAVDIIRGIPGRPGSAVTVATSARYIHTPAPGTYFYYARITQDDGKMLWSAPVWITQLRHRMFRATVRGGKLVSDSIFEPGNAANSGIKPLHYAGSMR